jgi:type II secretory pathway component GspD/PulD (secretin)
MAMFMGGQQQQQQGGRTARSVQLSIGVDTRTNTLVVSASDSLYRQIEALVSSLDASAGQARRTVRVVSMQNANSLVVQQTLSSLMGKVKTNAGTSNNNGRTGATSNSATTSSGSAGQNNDQQQQTQQQVDPTAQFMQQQMMRRMMFQGGPGGGFGRGGGRGGNNNGN